MVDRMFRVARRTITTCALVCVALVGCESPAQFAPNEYSDSLPPHVIEADIAHCKAIANDVQAEYGPHVEIGDSVFAAASENFAIHNRYKSECLRAKGYVVHDYDRIDLPASAIERARASHGEAEAVEGTE